MIHRFRIGFDNLPIRRKLTLGFVVIISLLIVGSVTEIIQSRIEDNAREKAESAQQDILLAENLRAEMLRVRIQESRVSVMFLVSGGVFDESLYQPIFDFVQRVVDILGEYKSRNSETGTKSTEVITKTQDAEDLILTYRDQVRSVVEDLAPQRGNAESGLGYELLTQINQLGNFVDVATVRDMAQEFVRYIQVESGVVELQIQVEGLRTEVDALDLTDAKKASVLTLVDEIGATLETIRQLDTEIESSYFGLADYGSQVEALSEELVTIEQEEYTDAQQDFENARDTSQNIRYAILGAILILSTLLAYGISRSIAKPVTLLTETTHQISNGAYNQRTNITAKDEIGQLAQSFDRMASEIQKREANLVEQAEELKNATAQAQSAARIKGEFLANMSHELRTPLNAIIGFSDMLLMGIAGELNSQQRHQVERLRLNGNRLLALVNDILDLTRIESKRVELILKPFSPRVLSERLASQMEGLAKDNNLKFEAHVDSSVPNQLIGDEKRIEQVMVNLISNAFKFTQQGSVRLEVKANLTERQWTIAVTDTGIGIPPHAINVIFEEFRQLDGTSTRAYQGSGLGLAITRNLVRIMSGEIKVQSKLGEGSTFTVTLPILEEGPARQKTEPAIVAEPAKL